jgi:membrane associated rhomboid family serine protease
MEEEVPVRGRSAYKHARFRRLPLQVQQVWKPRFLDGEIAEFSSLALKQGRIWVFITALFLHADWSHLLNNVVFFGAISRELEALMGPGGIAAVFFMTGIVGWLFTLAYNHFQYGEMADYVWSCGSSPATYGCAFFLATAAFDLAVAGSGSAGNLLDKPWLWYLAVVLAPVYSKGAPQMAWQALPVLLASGYYLLRPVIPEVSIGGWMALYFLKLFCLRLYDILVRKVPRDLPSADNACHLGGALAGVCLGLWYTATSKGRGEELPGLPLQGVYLSLLVAVLIARLVWNI